MSGTVFRVPFSRLKKRFKNNCLMQYECQLVVMWIEMQYKCQLAVMSFEMQYKCQLVVMPIEM